MPKVELNRHIWLFQGAPALKTLVVIYAHGEQNRNILGTQRYFKPREVGFNGNIFFYYPDGSSLVSNPADFFRDFAGRHDYEHYGPNQDVPDYELSKAATYHLKPSRPRSYQSELRLNFSILTNNNEAKANEGYLEYDWIQEMANRQLYDVAVIRNPRAFNGYTLKSAVRALRGYSGIGHIHCHFCRVKASDVADPARNHRITDNPEPPPPPPPI